jgi:hypothetical protein
MRQVLREPKRLIAVIALIAAIAVLSERPGTVMGTSMEGLTWVAEKVSGVRDAAGNPLASSVTSASVTIDHTAPTVTITSTAPDPATESPIPVTVEFSEPVFGFDEGDFLLQNATVGDFAGADTTFTLNLYPDREGSVTLAIGAGAAQDAAGNDNTPAAPLLRTYAVPPVCDRSAHSADPDADHLINLTELLRVIQFFNVKSFHCQAGTEDGYAPGPGDIECCTHASDYQPVDWGISLTELLRLIQFFNIGGYHACPDEGTEDGYCPGGPAR